MHVEKLDGALHFLIVSQFDANGDSIFDQLPQILGFFEGLFGGFCLACHRVTGDSPFGGVDLHNILSESAPANLCAPFPPSPDEMQEHPGANYAGSNRSNTAFANL